MLEFWQQFKQAIWGVGMERNFCVKVFDNLPPKMLQFTLVAQGTGSNSPRRAPDLPQTYVAT